MIRYMLDTNICIYLIKDKDPGLRLKLYDKGVGCCAISSITLAELSFGAYKSIRVEQNKLALGMFLTPFELLPFSTEAAFIYGNIRQQLELRGEIIGGYDLLIAAHALAEGLTLVTNNTHEFARVDNLSVENWVNHN
jgi:tRNA(fMet)-specific endonuclease VapC